jgi:hypothetical protein
MITTKLKKKLLSDIKVHLDCYSYDDEEMQEITELMKYNNFLETVSLTNISSKIILFSTDYYKNIKNLYLHNNNITSDSCWLLFDTIAINSSIELLNLKGNRIGSDPNDCKHISMALSKNTTLISLILDNNCIGSSLSTTERAGSLSTTERAGSLSTTERANNNLKYILDGLKINKTLKKLSVKDNKIDIYDATHYKYIGRWISSNNSLTKLYIYNSLDFMVSLSCINSDMRKKIKSYDNTNFGSYYNCICINNNICNRCKLYRSFCYILDGLINNSSIIDCDIFCHNTILKCFYTRNVHNKYLKQLSLIDL